MKQIVVAIDFSGASLNALRIAACLAEKTGANLQMIHVCKSCEDDTLNPSERTERDKKAAIGRMDQLLAEYQQQLGSKIDYSVHEGRIYKVVVERAKKIGADLIVAGTHGVSGFEEFFMGSNAYRIVTSSECPVLTINKSYTRSGFSKILLPLDASKSTRQKVPFTADLARVLGAQVVILGITPYDDDDLKHSINIYCKQAEEHLKSKGVSTTVDFTESRTIAGLVMEYAEKIDAGIISIMSDIESDSITRIMSPDVQRVVNHSSIPVLCSHPSQKFNYQISFTGVTG